MFGIDVGPSSQEQGQYNLLSGIAGFGTSVGEGDVNAAGGFYNTLLGGNQAATAKLLAPQIQGIQQRGQQQIQTAAQFGNRSGGTNAAAQNNIDSQRGEVNNMISQLTGGAASGLASLGTNLLSTGAQAGEASFNAANTIQQQKSAKWDDIFKDSLAVAGGAAGGIGNLDTTGGSTGGEQFMNFLNGAA